MLSINYRNITYIINYWAALLFIFWLPLKDDYLPAILALWIFTWLFEGNFQKRINQLSNMTLYVVLLSYFILTLIALIYSYNLEYGFFEVQKKLSMAFFPIFLAGSNQKVKRNFEIFLFVFLLGNLVAISYCMTSAFFTNLISENNHLYFKHWVYDGFKGDSFWMHITDRYNVFYISLSNLKHPSYFTVYILFSICILFYFFREKMIKKKWMKIAAYSIITYFSFIIYLLQSRAGLISLTLVFILIPVVEIKKKLKKRYLFIIITSIFVFSYLIVSSSRIKNNMNEFKTLYSNPTAFSLKTSDVRYRLWYTSIEVIKDNFWFGTSPANLTDELVKKYEELGFEGAAKEKLNSHNQYLETFAGLGIFGFLSLLFILIYSFILSIKNRNYLLFFLIIILAINFLFESMLNRMAGVLFMMFFISLLVFAREAKPEEEPKDISQNL